MNHTLSDSQLEEMIKSAVNSSSPLPPDEKFSQLISALRELQERRKAAMDSKPVAEVYQTPNVGICAALGPSIRMLCALEPGTKLYRHARPAPVVMSDAWPRKLIWSHHDDISQAEVLAWNNAIDACRAAMLNHPSSIQPNTDAAPGTEIKHPASNSPAIPDRWIPVSERMPDDSGRYWCYVEEQNDLGKSHYQWNCSWNGDRWWIESENGGIVTHWMPLPSAPREVK